MEIEAKFRLRPELRRSLELLLGTPVTRKRQSDQYLDVGKLPVALRMRRDGDAACVTLKRGFRKEAGIRVREEFEPAISLSEWETWLVLFGRLGFEAGEQVSKTRTVYDFRGVCVVLDDVEGLGDYCEVEVVSDDATDALARLESVIEELGLACEERITDSYRELLQQAATGHA